MIATKASVRPSQKAYSAGLTATSAPKRAEFAANPKAETPRNRMPDRTSEPP